MKPSATERVTLVEVLELKVPHETFESFIQATTRRLELEGVRGLVDIRFYVTPGSPQVGAIITFADSSQCMEHIRRISGWPEFKAMLDAVKPIDVRVYGPLDAEAQAWLRTMNVVSATWERCVAGFVR